MPTMTTVVSAVPTLRDAVNLAHLIAAANNAGYGALNVSTAAFKLDLVKGHAEPARANLLGISTIIEINIVEADIIRFGANSPAASANGPPFHLPHLASSVKAVAIAIMAFGRVSVRPISAVPDVQIQAAIVGLNRNRTTHLFARFAMVGERRCGEEQRRRKGKRGCSRFHDVLHHGCRNTQAISTEPERFIRFAFIKADRCPFLAIMS